MQVFYAIKELISDKELMAKFNMDHYGIKNKSFII